MYFMSVFMLVLHVHVYLCSYGQVWKQMEHDHYQNGYAYVYMITCKYRYYASHNIHDDSFDVMVSLGGGGHTQLNDHMLVNH